MEDMSENRNRNIPFVVIPYSCGYEIAPSIVISFSCGQQVAPFIAISFSIVIPFSCGHKDPIHRSPYSYGHEVAPIHRPFVEDQNKLQL